MALPYCAKHIEAQYRAWELASRMVSTPNNYHSAVGEYIFVEEEISVSELKLRQNLLRFFTSQRGDFDPLQIFSQRRKPLLNCYFF